MWTRRTLLRTMIAAAAVQQWSCAGEAERRAITLGVALPEVEDLHRGVELGLQEGKTAAALLEQDLTRLQRMEEFHRADAVISGELAGSVATLSPLPGGVEGTYRILPDAAERLAWLSAWAVGQGLTRWQADPALRPYLTAGGRITADAGEAADIRVSGSPDRWSAEWRSSGERVSLEVLAWHPQLFRYGATQLNQRFERRFGSAMGELAWAGWFAAKIAAEGALRGGRDGMHRWLAAGVFDGHKGAGLYFNGDRRLAHPMYLIQRRGDVTEIEELEMEESA